MIFMSLEMIRSSGEGGGGCRAPLDFKSQCNYQYNNLTIITLLILLNSVQYYASY